MYYCSMYVLHSCLYITRHASTLGRFNYIKQYSNKKIKIFLLQIILKYTLQPSGIYIKLSHQWHCCFKLVSRSSLQSFPSSDRSFNIKVYKWLNQNCAIYKHVTTFQPLAIYRISKAVDADSGVIFINLMLRLRWNDCKPICWRTGQTTYRILNKCYRCDTSKTFSWCKF